jgi:hypothetical protein
MKNKNARTAPKVAPKKESSEAIAASLGVSASAVYGWRANGTLPKNPLIRAAYLREVGAKQPKAVKK